MEGNAHLLQVIRNMRSQISKLEKENRALRGELQVCRQRAVPPEREAAKGDSTMTVRRYSTSSPAPASASTRSHRLSKRPPSNGLLETPASAQPPAPAAAAQLTPGEEKRLENPPATCPSYSHSSKVKLFREHVYKCRGKVKAVSFLLPVDRSSPTEKQGSLQSPPAQSTNQLPTIAEKDM